LAGGQVAVDSESEPVEGQAQTVRVPLSINAPYLPGRYGVRTLNTVEIRYFGTTNVYQTKSRRCQNSDTRL
jgi:hypothetical protein